MGRREEHDPVVGVMGRVERGRVSVGADQPCRELQHPKEPAAKWRFAEQESPWKVVQDLFGQDQIPKARVVVLGAKLLLPAILVVQRHQERAEDLLR